MLLKSDDFLSKNDDFLLNNVDFHNTNRSSASCPISTLLVSDFALYFTPLLLSYFNDSPPFSLYVSPLRLSTFCIFTLFAPILLQFCSDFAPILLQFCSDFAPILLHVHSIIHSIVRWEISASDSHGLATKRCVLYKQMKVLYKQIYKVSIENE